MIHRTAVLRICLAVVALLVPAAVRAADPPTLLVLPLDMTDTSGETPARTKEHDERLISLAQFLSAALRDDGIYAIVDPAPVRAAVDKARAAQPLSDCHGCEQDLGRAAGADRVLIGEVDKVSTLIGSLRLSIINVATGQPMLTRVLSFRGDTDEAWRRAAKFFVRDLQDVSAQQR